MMNGGKPANDKNNKKIIFFSFENFQMYKIVLDREKLVWQLKTLLIRR